MCGIAGMFSYSCASLQVDENELQEIRDSMVSRGPDAKGIWISHDRRVGLAHRRLSIIDLSESASQPMSNTEGTLQIVFNGEIYNYHELKKDLVKRGYRFKTTSDTEVLLHLYAEYKTGMFEYIRGMYAFAVWDDTNKALLLARDPLGIKPLYYADDGNSIRFASQVKSLLKSKHINTSPQAAGYVGFYLWGYVPEPYTLYEGVYSLPAGKVKLVKLGEKPRDQQFFNLREEIQSATEIYSSKIWSSSEINELVQCSIKDSVANHLIADVDVGIFQSAGIDSSVITATSREMRNDVIKTITLAIDEYRNTENDESVLAEVISGRYSTSQITSYVKRKDFEENRDHLLSAMDQPSIDGVNTFFVSKIASESGLKVALSGIGGDELFGGYPSFKDVPRLSRMFWWTKCFPGLGKSFRILSSPILKSFTSPKYAGLLEYGSDYSGAYLLRRGLYMPWELPEVLDGDMVRKGWTDLQPLINLEQSIAGISQARMKVSTMEISQYMRNQLLRDADWAGMAHSLEIRTPLVDVKLLRDILPVAVSYKNTLTKNELASVPAINLPQAIVSRKKTGFNIPVRDWLMSEKSSEMSRGLRPWANFLIRRNYAHE